MKKSLYLLVALGMLAALIVSGCGDVLGTKKDTNEATVGKNSAAASKSPLAVGDSHCPAGGIAVNTGIDTNGDGTLQTTEVTATEYVCNGAAGATGSAGTTGPAGPAGPAGQKALVDFVTEAAGANCANGGLKVTSGIDADADNVLDAGEISTTKYACNGADLTAGAKPESCAVCHSGAGAKHQARYNERYQNTMVVSNLTYTNDGTSDIVTFKMTKSGASFDCRQADALGIYFTEWNGATFPYDQSIKGTLTYDAATNVCTSTKAKNATKGDLSQYDGLVVLYGRDETVEVIGHLTPAKFPFSSMLETKGTVTYSSAANVAGCEKCHTVPYLKHAYIYGNNGNVSGQDFWTCKACHYDTRNGGHADWQVLVDDPVRYAGIVSSPLTTAEKNKYAYKAKLMNDVHMSHAMEFAYPQSMANCVTCHSGKLTATLSDANFTIETCRSCHPVTAADGTDSHRAPALKEVMPSLHGSGILDTLYADATPGQACNDCHKAGGLAQNKVFNTIHTGYNDVIYAADGTKYADAITASIDSASLSGNVLNIKFSVTDTLSTGYTITPSVYVSLYGYDTKDFIVPSHMNDSNKKRTEKTIGTANPLFTEVATGVANNWEVNLDLAAYAKTPSIPDMIADGTIKRLEISVLPTVGHPTKTTTNHSGQVVAVSLAVNAPSKTFDIADNAFVNYFTQIVDADKCNNCHDALGTTFHSADRGGNVTVCRNCHAVPFAGSHMEMQSRSIDSYVHAIHSFQPFDIGDVDFDDAVEELHYEHHVESHFPTFDIQNCESCHNAGTYNVPDQSKSMPSLHAGSDTVAGRNIGAVPGYVTGPASRACGACHRAELINEDDAAGLAAFNQHTETNGYLVDATGTSAEKTALWESVVETIMSIFK